MQAQVEQPAFNMSNREGAMNELCRVGGLRIRLNRTLTKLGVLCSAFALMGPVNGIAADYPSRPIRYTHASAGGLADLMARAFTDKLSQRTGQPAVVESRPGAGGLVSYQGCVSQSDGYTLCNASVTTFTLPYTLKAFKGSVEQDMILVAPLIVGRNVIVAHPSLPVKNMDELLAYMRANPGKVNLSVNTQFDHMQSIALQNLTGVKFETIRYPGLAANQNALVAGEVHVQLTGQTAWTKSLAEGGRVRPLAVNGQARDKLFLPQVPALAESSSPELKELAKSILFQPAWIGVAVGSKTPRPIVETLYAHAKEIVKDPEFIKRMRDVGWETLETLPTLAESAEMMRNGLAEFGRIAKQAGIEPQ